MGDGYEADKKGMTELAGDLRDEGRALGEVERPLRGRSCGSEDELGEFASGAFSNFYGAWCQETDVIIDALGELATKLEQSAGTYSSVDAEHGRGFAKIGGF
ncbi:hypothetical protein [Actinocrispum sp. NPDC049592]|uniref:WXG100 family type VII secretion target n=1 Tax=Actinocrispum sp. NPDC049592 TaxID=3154835 RepID=UPI003412636F